MFSNSDGSQYVAMTTKPVSRLIVSLAIPTVISMLVSSIYNYESGRPDSRGINFNQSVPMVFSIGTTKGFSFYQSNEYRE